MRRFSIAGLLGFVAVFAFGLAALVGATDAWVGATFTLTVGVLLGSVLGIIIRGWRAGGWLGFALFGWGYFLLGNVPGLGLDDYQTILPDSVAEWVFWTANPLPAAPTLQPTVVIPPPPPMNAPLPPPIPGAPTAPIDMRGAIVDSRESPEQSEFEETIRRLNRRSENARPIAYWLSVLIFAEAGAILGLFLTREEKAVGAVPASLVRAEPEILATTPPNPVDCR